MTASIPYDDRALLAAPPTLRLDGKVLWITGASRGLGRALAYAVAGAGGDVLLTARSSDDLAGVAADITAQGRVAQVVAGSVTDLEHVERAAAIARDTWGRIDVLVNNAGISPHFKRSELIEDDEWAEVVDVNLNGAFRCCRAAVDLMDPGGGSIVNVSSVHGSVGQGRVLAYAASKGGLELLTRTLAVEWAARGIRVNSVAPGYLETDMTGGLRAHPHWGPALIERIPMGRYGLTAEVAAAVLFLAADVSSYVTGATLFVDGGWTAQ
jgi:NAD(P)-dependent dehydrogenase (short-subunit alcohol dehydrogenase family)